MTKEELFFLCVLTGAKEIIGLDSPVEGLNEVETKTRWKTLSEGLYEKGWLYNDTNGQLTIKDEIAKIATTVAYPDVIYITSLEKEDSHYIYIKGDAGFQLSSKEDTEMKQLDKKDELISYLNQHFQLSSCESEVYLETTTENMDLAVAQLVEGNIQDAIQTLEISDKNVAHAQSALQLFVDQRSAKDFIGYRANQETASEAWFKTVKTEEGTWVFRIKNAMVRIYRKNPHEALVDILNF